jgi:hypothetical protein
LPPTERSLFAECADLHIKCYFGAFHRVKDWHFLKGSIRYESSAQALFIHPEVRNIASAKRQRAAGSRGEFSMKACFTQGLAHRRSGQLP